MGALARKELNIEVKTFEQLENSELYALLKLRVDVFVVEQACAYAELDSKDSTALHIMGRNEELKLVAVSRILKGESLGNLHIGRVAVVKSYRRQGFGKAIMNKAIEYCQRELSAEIIHLAAQLYLKDFYEALGFTQTGEVYDWDGIAHIDMNKVCPKV